MRSKIVPGESATIDEFPWLALLAVLKKTSNGKMEFIDEDPHYRCGGSLISDKWILTAGQCIVLKYTAIIVDGYNIELYVSKFYSTMIMLHFKKNSLVVLITSFNSIV